MNKEQERYLYFHNYYINKGINVATSIAVLDYLTTHKEDYENISKIAPAFVHAVIKNFWARAVIDLSEFYYQSGDLSFTKFLCYIKSNWNLIYTDDFDVRKLKSVKGTVKRDKITKDKVFAIIDNCENLINTNEDKLQRLKFFRDNVFAHFGDESKQKETVTISIDLLKYILLLTEQIIIDFEILHTAVGTVLTPINATDISQICNAVSKWMEYRKQIIAFDRQKREAELYGKDERQRH